MRKFKPNRTYQGITDRWTFIGRPDDDQTYLFRSDEGHLATYSETASSATLDYLEQHPAENSSEAAPGRGKGMAMLVTPDEMIHIPLTSDPDELAHALVKAIRRNPGIASDESTLSLWLGHAIQMGYDIATASHSDDEGF